MSVHPLKDLPDRAWYAWHCLPRGPRGKQAAGLSQAKLHSIFTGRQRSVTGANAVRLAEALHVSLDWLINDKSTEPPPKLTGPITDRIDEYREYDVSELAAKAEAAGGATSIVSPRNNLEAAVLTLIDQLSSETIAEVVAEFAGREQEKPPHHWGKILREREAARRGLPALSAPKPTPPRAAPAKKEKKPESTREPKRRVG